MGWVVDDSPLDEDEVEAVMELFWQSMRGDGVAAGILARCHPELFGHDVWIPGGPVFGFRAE